LQLATFHNIRVTTETHVAEDGELFKKKSQMIDLVCKPGLIERCAISKETNKDVNSEPKGK